MTTSRQQYIEQYAEYSMEQMRKYGIPASITLAQGIIESADGRSTLAQTANNHFGVKGEYDGHFVLANDDKPNEKFKKYEDVGQSFEDHSKVLLEERYQKHCAELAPDDYRGWAEGIKAGGYATAKNYVNTLVSVIEGADLQKYDRMVLEQAEKEGKKIGTADYHHTTDASPSLTTQSNSSYSLPLERKEFLLVSSPFGTRTDPMDQSKTQFHKGIDISCKNENLLATENNGKVINVNHNGNTAGGKSVTIEYRRDDGSKYQTTYMHMSDIGVKVGDSVNAGQKIGVSGNSGTHTTGPHLHFEVRSISSDGSTRSIDPAAYLAEVCQKGHLTQQLLYNGKDLLVPYSTEAPETQQETSVQAPDYSQTPDEWMKKLLSSEDSGVSLGAHGDPIIDMIVTLFSSLMALALQIDNKDQEEKMQSATDAAIQKRIDLSPLLPNLKECTLSIEDGKPRLFADNGAIHFTHELTNAELYKIQQTLANPNLSEEEKRASIASVVNSIVVTQQMSQNFQQGMEAQQNQQETTIQRK